MAPKIHIVGAGLSGMVASILLARKGYEVRVIEGGSSIGGMGGLHPSVHATPIDPAWMSRKVGIDLTSVFHKPREFALGIEEKTFSLPVGTLHCVERGSRKGSIDALLYHKATEAGVTFDFGVHLKDLREIPKGSIIATGLHPEMYDYFEIPFEIPRGFASRSTTERGPWCAGVLASYTDDYFYASSANGLLYALLFGRGKVSAEALEVCRRDIAQRFDLDVDAWEYFTARVPTGSARNPRLFQDGYILAGSLSGAMDPNGLFGIHGAILSGKVAAEAVQNPEAGLESFKKLNKYYSLAYCMKEFLRFLPRRLRNSIFLLTVTHPRAMFPMIWATSLGVPGYRKGVWYYDILRQRSALLPRGPSGHSPDTS
jgi:flavin-dependent dehydrogenase